MRLHIIGSTGRTATNFVADVLSQNPKLISCHEGYKYCNGAKTQFLPLINLENRALYQRQDGEAILNNKRDNATLQKFFDEDKILIDVAYYNAMAADPILSMNPNSKFVGIIRDCRSFVKSSTVLTGEDPLPVGWPPKEKSLTAREKFISAGRIKPGKSDKYFETWNDFSTIQKNIWLWKETNLRILACKDKYPGRVLILSFDLLTDDRVKFINSITNFFDLEAFDYALDNANRNQRKARLGFELEWSSEDVKCLQSAQKEVNERWKTPV